ncbi:hypothetical protein ASALC70_02771 [Alcanivorax sp. ALC70]|nr:hypothetical protein ASALC70_02771 [Alcanivorax sp. ALC70]
MGRFLPKTAFTRAALIVGLVIGLSQGVTLWFFARNAYLPGIREYARLTALQAELVFQPGGDASLGRRLGETTGILPGTPPDVRTPQTLVLSKPVVDRFRQELSERLGERATVRLEEDRQPILWVTAPSFEGGWLRVPMAFFRDYDRYLLLGWG